jgi:hypothetical protein
MSESAGNSNNPLDLTKDEKLGDVSGLAVVPYDPAQDREKVRGWIAGALIALLIGFISLLCLAIVFGIVKVADLDKIVATVLTPIMGIVGTVIGFYFGEKSR